MSVRQAAVSRPRTQTGALTESSYITWRSKTTTYNSREDTDPGPACLWEVTGKAQGDQGGRGGRHSSPISRLDLPDLPVGSAEGVHPPETDPRDGPDPSGRSGRRPRLPLSRIRHTRRRPMLA